MTIDFNKFEVEFLRDSLRSKQLEYKSIGLKTGTIDSILGKINEKPKEDNAKMKGISFAVENSSDELIIHAPSKGRLTKLDYEIPDKASEIREMQNYLVEKHLEEMMDSLKPNLNIPFIKR